MKSPSSSSGPKGKGKPHATGTTSAPSPSGGVEKLQKKKTKDGMKPAPSKGDGKKKAARSELDDIFAMTKGGGASSSGGGGTDVSKTDDGLSPELKEIAERIKKAREAKARALGNKGDSGKPKVEGSKDDIFGGQSNKGRKRTEEGFFIYSEEELGLNKGGGDTDLCPFDCDCCY